jgi:ubiquinone/menaquinone biosynthesis C-methylase UbiE
VGNQQIHSFGFVSLKGRKAKALKILTVLIASGTIQSHSHKLKLLDIGTGNGEIASNLAEYFDVTSVDIVDQRQATSGFEFILLNNQLLPFANQSFDIVVSNHVVEHVNDSALHFAEIARVLNKDGLVYLATPNRLWPWEVHYHVPFLHYLPQPVFTKLIKCFGKYQEPVGLLTWWSLKAKTESIFSLTVFSDHMIKWPNRYHLSCNSTISLLLSWIPLRFYQAITFIHPTLVLVLKPKD